MEEFTQIIEYVIVFSIIEAILVSASFGLLIGISSILLLNKHFPPKEEKQRGRNGFDQVRKVFRARQRAAWLCKNAEIIIANDNVAFDYALAA